MDIVQALEKELEHAKKKVNALGKALEAFRGTLIKGHKGGGMRPKRKMSAAARKRISMAQKARWAKQKAGKS